MLVSLFFCGSFSYDYPTARAKYDIFNRNEILFTPMECCSRFSSILSTRANPILRADRQWTT